MALFLEHTFQAEWTATAVFNTYHTLAVVFPVAILSMGVAVLSEGLGLVPLP